MEDYIRPGYQELREAQAAARDADSNERKVRSLTAMNKRLEDSVNRLLVEKGAAIHDRNELLVLARDLLDELVKLGQPRDQISSRDGRLPVVILHPYD